MNHLKLAMAATCLALMATSGVADDKGIIWMDSGEGAGAKRETGIVWSETGEGSTVVKEGSATTKKEKK